MSHTSGGTPSTDGIKATETSSAILEALKQYDGAGVTELAAAVGKSKSTVHGHLKSLERDRWVVKDGNEYRIGLRFLDFGGYARDQRDLYEAIKPEVDELVEETGETVQMVAEEHGRGIYLYQAHGNRAVKTDSYTGNDVYLHCTAVGKTILAHLPDRRVEEITERHGLPEKTPRTITDREELFDQLETIRERGHAFDDGERIEGIRCVAVPITKNEGDLVGALSLSGPENRITGEWFHETIPELLEQTARIIEIKLTYS